MGLGVEWIIVAGDEAWKGVLVVCIATGLTDVCTKGFGVNTSLFGWYSNGIGEGLG